MKKISKHSCKASNVLFLTLVLIMLFSSYCMASAEISLPVKSLINSKSSAESTPVESTPAPQSTPAESTPPESTPAESETSSEPSGITVTGLTLTTSNSNKKIAINNDKLTVKFYAKNVTVTEATVAGEEVEIADDGDGKWTGSYIVTGNEDLENGKDVPFSITVEDSNCKGNKKELTQEDTDHKVVYYAPLDDDTNISFKIKDSKKAYAKQGDSLVLSVSANIDVDDRLSVKIAGVPVLEKDSDESGVKGNASFPYKLGSNKDELLTENSEIKFYVEDKYYQSIVASNKSNDENKIIYYAPIETAISELSFTSSNENGELVKIGDKVTVNFKTSHPVSLADTKIGENTVEFTSKDNNNMNWSGCCTVQAGTFKDNTSVPFSFTVNDAAENLPVKITNADTDKKIIYYTPVETAISDFSVISSNKNQARVKIGDTVTVNVKTSHPVQCKAAKIGNGDAIFKEENGQSTVWELTRKIQEGDFDDNANINFKLVLSDAAGNAGTTKLQEAKSISYLAPIKVTNLSFLSDSTNKRAVKSGGKVTLSFQTQHKVKLNSVKIAGKIIEPKSKDSKYWSAEYTIQSNDAKEDNTVIPFTFSGTDNAGNTITKTESDTEQIRYYAPIESAISAFSVTSNNKNTARVKNGNTVTVKFKTSHPVQCEAVQIGNGNAELKSENNQNMVWELTRKIQDGDFEDNSNVNFKLVLNDTAGNAEVQKSQIVKGITYLAPIKVTNLSFLSDSTNKRAVKSGGKVTLLFQTQHEVKLNSVKIAGKNITPKSKDSKYWSAEYTIQSNDAKEDNVVIPFTFSSTDDAGNTIVKSESDTANVRYYAPIKITNLEIMSDNSKSSSYAKDGNTISVHFNTTHPVTVSKQTIAGQAMLFSSLNNNGMNWTGSYKISKSEVSDNSMIPFTFTAADGVNSPVEKAQYDTVNNKKVTYFAQIKQCIKDFKFETNNEPSNYAKNGSILKVSFQTTHPVTLSDTTIAGENITPTDINGGGTDWKISYKIIDGQIEDNTDVKFNLKINDAASNPEVVKTEYDADKIHYQAPILIKDLLFQSNNKESHNIARNGDVITIKFSTTHPVYFSNTKIAGKEIVFSSQKNEYMEWSADYKLENGCTKDGESVGFDFTAKDKAGNADAVKTQTDAEPIKYYAPIEVSNLKIFTNNVNNINKYAKDGDIVTVSFSTNHEAQISNMIIAGKPAANLTNISSTGTAYNCSFNYALKSGDLKDLSNVPFIFQADDAAGNDTLFKKHTDNDVTNKIMYFAPITAKAKITSTGKAEQFAKNGDTINVNIAANHKVTAKSPQIFGNKAVASGTDIESLTVKYSIPRGELNVKEGITNFSIPLNDSAGNTLAINSTADNSKVIYDRTKPAVELKPDFSGFLNEGIIYKISYSDCNISQSNIFAKVNNEQKAAALTQNLKDGKTFFTKTLDLKKEGTYNIIGTAIDNAGNISDPNVTARVVIDKTSPKITFAKVQTDKTPAYNKGFCIASYFNIDEKYIKNIVCKVSDYSGSVDWDVNNPINTDGKKTIYLLATDMSGNTSQALSYDIYIDGTAPKIVIKDTVSKRELTADKENNPFVSKMSLNISLDKLEVGNESKDKFTSLRLVNKNGQLVYDPLKGSSDSAQNYTINIPDFGEYTLIANAVDDVGNKTESAYSFALHDKTLIEKYFENKPLFYTSASIFAVLLIVLAIIIVKRIQLRLPEHD